MDGVHQTGILSKASHLANAATFLILFATDALVLADASATVHLWLTYVAAGVLAAHFSVVAIAPPALRERAGVATPPLHA
jgi:hypothetical protein